MSTPEHLIFTSKNRGRDEWFTPDLAVLPLLQYITPDKTIWECTDPGNSRITTVFKQHGNKVISTHINTGTDFLAVTKETAPDYDIIVTNPPYSLKVEFVKKAVELGKPFAFLLPLPSIAQLSFVQIFRSISIELLLMGKRVSYIFGTSTNSTPPFNSVWLTHNLLPKQLIFVDLNDYIDKKGSEI